MYVKINKRTYKVQQENGKYYIQHSKCKKSMQEVNKNLAFFEKIAKPKKQVKEAKETKETQQEDKGILNGLSSFLWGDQSDEMSQRSDSSQRLDTSQRLDLSQSAQRREGDAIEITRYRNEAEKAKGEAESLRREIEFLKATSFKQSDESNSELKATIQQQREKIRDFKKYYEQAQEEIGSLTSKLSQPESKSKGQKRQLPQTPQIPQMRQQVKNAIKKLRQTIQENERLNEDYEELRRDNLNFITRIDELEQELTAIKRQKPSLNGQKSQSLQIQEMQMQRQQSQAIQKSEQAQRRLKKDMSKMERELKQLQDTNAELNAEYEKLFQENKDYQRRLKLQSAGQYRNTFN